MSWLDELEDEYRDFAKELKTQRDDVEVRLHLLSMEAKAEWNELEQKYDHLRGKLKKTSEAAESSSEDVKSAMKLLADELKAGYRKIKNTLT